MAMCASLHLIRPLGFDTSEHALRRAGLDYWPRLAPSEHHDWHAAAKALSLAPAGPRPLWLFTTKATTPVWSAPLRPGDALVFGKETAGLPDALLHAYPDRTLTLPMLPDERSLNLATAVCAVLCEGVRQCVARGDVRLDARGRIIPVSH